ncbi:uncharacterized protein LOC124155321 [Ischnura elegans]|uniref:uncharacterized protein LOC124155321 n=1 Tax=Ischnura elegans TaxID=197161 RepID=UPI001ED89A2B|nr:uncharacterized protein LOC124155321 [Ischnura elegans]
MVVSAKVFLLVGILVIGINFFPSERGLTDAAPVKDPAITPAHHEAFDGKIGIGARDPYDETNEPGARYTDVEDADQGARDAFANNKQKRKGRGTLINVSN